VASAKSSDRQTNIAALITCHDRREQTLSCLDALFASAGVAKVNLTVVLVDDGSSDGTGEAIAARFPQVHQIRADGTLFWNRGMFVAFEWALAKGFDHYLWLNDDTTLYPQAIAQLLETEAIFSALDKIPPIVVGNVIDPGTGDVAYGGRLQPTGWRPLRLTLAASGTEPVQCDTFNGNCVLIPAAVAERLGNLDKRFAHAMGDIDYGFRARAAGIGIRTAGPIVGTCLANHGGVIDRSLSPWERLKLVASRKRLPPGSWLIFTWRHTGWLWPAYFAWPYVRAFFWRVS
jgi:GT2 family glycosyltransferase